MHADHDRQRFEKEREVLAPLAPLETQPVGRVVGDGDETRIQQHLGDAPPVDEVDHDGDQRPARRRLIGVLVDTDLRQIDGEQRHRQQEQRPDQQRPPRSYVPDKNPDTPADRRERPERRHRVAFRETDGDKPVRYVIPTAGRQRPAGQQAQNGHECRVEDRNQQDERRHRDDCQHVRLARSLVPRSEGHRRQARTDEQAPAVAEKHGGRGEIVDEERCAAAEQQRQIDCVRVVQRAAAVGDEQRRHGNDSHSRAQPVHVIEQVERVS